MVYLALIWVAEAVPHGYLAAATDPEAARQGYAKLGQHIAALVDTCRQST